MQTLTVLQLLDDRSSTASKIANRCRDNAATRVEAQAIDHKSYKMGEAIGLLDARELMEKELRRLCNRFQNGCLSIDDFGIDL